jgi:hypothetical protein
MEQKKVKSWTLLLIIFIDIEVLVALLDICQTGGMKGIFEMPTDEQASL